MKAVMFNKETYIQRRAELKKLVKDGIILLFGNNESPVNSPANGYSPSVRIRRFYIIWSTT